MQKTKQQKPLNVSAIGLKPARRLQVPKSEILHKPLYVFTKTFSPFISL